MSRVTFTPCHVQHLAFINVRDVDRRIVPYYLSGSIEEVIANSMALSIWVDNRCMGAAGVVEVDSRTAYAWSLLSADSGPYMLAITRKTIQVLDGFRHLRVEMRVNNGFTEAHKWAKMLGFQCEAPLMRKSGFFGEDQSLYARVF